MLLALPGILSGCERPAGSGEGTRPEAELPWVAEADLVAALADARIDSETLVRFCLEGISRLEDDGRAHGR